MTRSLDRSFTENRPTCPKCSRPILVFDGSVMTSGSPEEHTDCAKAATKDYGRIAYLFNTVGYDMSRTLWGNYMHATHTLPEDKQKELDSIVLPVLHKLDAALSEAWSA